jgi:predicted ATP-grasp superfamily ATP-dependent carboligase
MTSVLVLDGEQRAALAVARSLCRAGINVTIASSQPHPIASASRDVSNCLRYPSPEYSTRAFLDWVAAINVRPMIPISDVSSMLLRSASPQTDDGYDSLTDKAKLLASASAADVPIPISFIARSNAELAKAAAAADKPLVLKPARSRVRISDQIVPTAVRVIGSPELTQAALDKCDWFPATPVILQQFIPGHGAGVFCLYDRDHAIAWFAHRRLREKPPSGGVSVLCESVPVDPVLKDYADRLLRAVEYRGVAMVEFRITPDGRPYLMEVNARFWGSLQLAIDCGVDFPWLYYQLLAGETVQPVTDYEVGRRLRWLLGDLDHLLIRLRNPSESLGNKIAAISTFLGTGFDSHCRQEVFRRRDPGPGWLELRQWIADAIGRER